MFGEGFLVAKSPQHAIETNRCDTSVELGVRWGTAECSDAYFEFMGDRGGDGANDSGLSRKPEVFDPVSPDEVDECLRVASG